MDLKSFVTSFDESQTYAASSEAFKTFVEDFERFTRSFAQLLMVCQVNSLSLSDQEPLKAGFLAQWSDYIAAVNTIVAAMAIDDTFSWPVHDLGTFEFSPDDTYICVFVGDYHSSAWAQERYATGYDSTWRDTVITSPVNYMNYAVFKNTTDTTYVVINIDIDSGHTTGDESDVFARRLFQNVLVDAIVESQSVDIEVDLLSVEFTLFGAMTDIVDEIVTACELGTS
jgi:hypothetical protein